MTQCYQDAMSIVAKYGKPDLFLTFTCNPKWDEITRELSDFQTANDRPELVARVFRMKVKAAKKDIINRKLFGSVDAFICVIKSYLFAIRQTSN